MLISHCIVVVVVVVVAHLQPPGAEPSEQLGFSHLTRGIPSLTRPLWECGPPGSRVPGSLTFGARPEYVD